MATITLELPYPPSLNSYYRHVKSKVLISAKGRRYRSVVKPIIAELGIERITKDVIMLIEAYPPDRRRRDADNIEKCLWDSLVHGNLLADDSQIKIHINIMGEPMREIGGMVVVTLWEFDRNNEVYRKIQEISEGCGSSEEGSSQ